MSLALRASSCFSRSDTNTFLADIGGGGGLLEGKKKTVNDFSVNFCKFSMILTSDSCSDFTSNVKLSKYLIHSTYFDRTCFDVSESATNF